MPTVDEFLAGLGFADAADPLKTPLPPRPAALAPGQSGMVDPGTLAALGLPFPTAQATEMPGSAPPLDTPLGQGAPTGDLAGSQPGVGADLMAALGATDPNMPAGG